MRRPRTATVNDLHEEFGGATSTPHNNSQRKASTSTLQGLAQHHDALEQARRAASHGGADASIAADTGPGYTSLDATIHNHNFKLNTHC